MELLIFGHSGRAVLFFPTRMARFYDYENWGVVDALRDQIDGGHMQLFCLDSVDAESFYNRNVHPDVRIRRHLQYEDYIIHEVLPLMHLKNNSGYFEVAGCSMGAYHAVNLAMKHPHMFKKTVGMSGRYDLTRQVQDFRDLFDGYHNQSIYFNTPRQFIANMHQEADMEALRRLEIILVIGETDPFIWDNREFSELLWHKDVPHQFYIWDNYAHRPRYWKQMVKLYL